MSPAVRAARAYLGCPFAHQGRSRQGMDCAGLVILVGRDLGALPPTWDANGYAKVPDGSMFQHCETMLVPSPGPAPGRIALMRFDKEPQHLGVLGEHEGRMTLIHALQSTGRVVEHSLTDPWPGRILAYYSFKDRP